MLRWDKTNCNKVWIRHDDNIWLIEHKSRLHHCINE